MKLKLMAFALLFVSIGAYAQTADEIINKSIDAIGGAENWKKVKSIKQEGTMNVQGADVEIALTAEKNKGSRQDITISAMGMTGYMLITPTEGWTYMPFNGQTAPEAMTGDDLAQSQDALDTEGSLIDYKSKGHTVEYLGKEDVDGTECLKLKLTHKSGKIETLFIDPSSYYVIKNITKQKTNGQEVEQATSYSNYEKLPEGIVIPKTVTLPFGDLNITKVEVNGTIDENVFKKS